MCSVNKLSVWLALSVHSKGHEQVSSYSVRHDSELLMLSMMITSMIVIIIDVCKHDPVSFCSTKLLGHCITWHGHSVFTRQARTNVATARTR